MQLRVVHAVLLPYSAPVSQYAQDKFWKPKDAPATYESDIEFEVQKTETTELNGHRIERTITVIDQTVMVAEHTYTFSSPLTTAAIETKNQLNEQLREEFVKSVGYQGDLIEEYVTLTLIAPKEDPEKLIKKNQFFFARFLRPIDSKITEEEAKEILSTQVRHGKDYLAIVDWEGAIIVSAEDDFESDLDLLLIGNYQLLRYRMLDREIDKRLQRAQETILSKKKTFLPSTQSIDQLINTELSLLLDYDRIDQSILLIGDWYSGKLYRMITEEFYVQDWKNNVKNKLQTLSQAEDIIKEKYSISWDRLLDFIQIFGWLFLLIGYFVLFYLDVS